MAASRAPIEEILAEGQTVYGVNTGFGKLSDVRIPQKAWPQLQTNLVRSHAGRVGSRSRGGVARHAAAARQCAGQGIQRLPS